MQIQLIDFPSIIKDNDSAYFNSLEAIINSVDENSISTVIKTPSSYIFRISVSDISLVDSLISSINQLHTFLKISLNYSKSSKKSGTIQFTIVS